MDEGQEPKPIVMLSSTFLDLVKLRALALQKLPSLGFYVDPMENSGGDVGLDLIDSSLAMVDRADAYILILGFRCGDPPNCATRNPNRRSLTELEFERAVERDLPVMLLMMADDYPAPVAEVRAAANQNQALGEFKARAVLLNGRTGVQRVYQEFSSDDEFASNLAAGSVALQRLLAERKQSARTLRSVDSGPFQPVNSAAALFQTGRANLIPSWSDIASGETPSRPELAELQGHLAVERGAILIGPQSSGKTTLIKLLAHREITEGRKCFSLDLAAARGTTDSEVMADEAADGAAIWNAMATADPASLFIIENAHRAPAAVVHAINRWIELPLAARPALLISQRPITPGSAPWDLSPDATESASLPEVRCCEHATLLQDIVLRIWKKAQGGAPPPTFSRIARQSWDAMAGDLAAFSLAVWAGSRSRSWDGTVSPQAARQYVEAKYLANLDIAARELLIQISCLADASELAIMFEDGIELAAKPLLDRGVVNLIKPGPTKTERLQISHPSVAQLILASVFSGKVDYWNEPEYRTAIKRTRIVTLNAALSSADVEQRTERGKRFVAILEEMNEDGRGFSLRPYFVTRRMRAAFRLGLRNPGPFLNDPSFKANRDFLDLFYRTDAPLDHAYAQSVLDRYESLADSFVLADRTNFEASAALMCERSFAFTEQRITCLLAHFGAERICKLLGEMQLFVGLNIVSGYNATFFAQTDGRARWIQTVFDFLAVSDAQTAGEPLSNEELENLWSRPGFFPTDQAPHWLRRFANFGRTRGNVLTLRYAAQTILRSFTVDDLFRRWSMPPWFWQQAIGWLRTPNQCEMTEEESATFANAIAAHPRYEQWFLPALYDQVPPPNAEGIVRVMPFGNLPELALTIGQIPDDDLRRLMAKRRIFYWFNIPLRPEWRGQDMLARKALMLLAGCTLCGLVTQLPPWFDISKDEVDRTLRLERAKMPDNPVPQVNASISGTMLGLYEFSRRRGRVFSLDLAEWELLVEAFKQPPFPFGARIAAMKQVTANWLGEARVEGNLAYLDPPISPLLDAVADAQVGIAAAFAGEIAQAS